jgi:pentatricopeptide repeat protein
LAKKQMRTTLRVFRSHFVRFTQTRCIATTTPDNTNATTQAKKDRKNTINSSRTIKTLCEQNKLDEALDCLVYYKRSGVKADARLFTPILSAIAAHKNINMLQRFMYDMKAYYRVEPDVHHQNILLRVLCKDSPQKAKEYFAQMQEKTMITYGIMVTEITRHIKEPKDSGYLEILQPVFTQLLAQNLKLTVPMLKALTTAYTNLKQEDKAIQMLKALDKLSKDHATTDKVVTMLISNGKIDEAIQLSNSIETMNTVIRTLIEKGNADKAKRVFDSMHKTIKPDATTYNMFLSLYSKDANKMQQLYKQMKENNITPDV